MTRTHTQEMTGDLKIIDDALTCAMQARSAKELNAWEEGVWMSYVREREAHWRLEMAKAEHIAAEHDLSQHHQRFPG